MTSIFVSTVIGELSKLSLVGVRVMVLGDQALGLGLVTLKVMP